MTTSKQAVHFALVAAVHLALLAGLLSYQPARQAMLQIIPVVARIIPPEPVSQPALPAPAPKVAPRPKPRPAPEPARAQEPAPALTTQIIAAESTPAAQEPVHTVPAAQSASAPIAQPSAPAPASAPISVTPPRSNAAYLNNPKPEYPAASLRLGEAGRVVLNVQVSAQGNAEQVSVHSSSGYARLDQAALKAVKQWKFVPARRGTENVAAQVLVPITFKTENE